MKEIIFRTETKAYRWRPTRWQIALKYILQAAFVGISVYALMFMVGVIEMGM